jgi:hypothetical protein
MLDAGEGTAAKIFILPKSVCVDSWDGGPRSRVTGGEDASANGVVWSRRACFCCKSRALCDDGSNNVLWGRRRRAARDRLRRN